MQRQFYLTCIGLGLAIVGLMAGSGCAGPQATQVRQGELERLRRRTASQNKSLGEFQRRIRRLQERVKGLITERDAAREFASGLQKRTREAKQRADRMAIEKVKAEGRLLEKERSYEELEKQLELIQKTSSESKDDAIDLRMNYEEMMTRGQELAKMTRILTEENRSLSKQLTVTKKKLQRADAVVRSFTEQDDTEKAVSGNLRAKVRELEYRNKNLGDENRALIKKMRLLTENLSSEPLDPELLAGREQGTVYGDDPAGLWAEVKAFLGGRYQAIISREAKWDGVNVGLFAATTVAFGGLIWLVLIPRRLKKRKGLRDELEDLRYQLEDLEDHGGGNDDAGQRPRRFPRQGSMVHRSGQFSPIISTDLASDEDDDSSEDVDLQALDDANADVEQTVMLGGGGRVGGAARGSNVIGARQWSGDSAGKQGAQGRDPLAGSSRNLKKDLEEAVDEDGDDDEFSNTQIIPSLHELDDLGGPLEKVSDKKAPGKKKGASSSADLMSELEDLIGKKVDELIE